MGKNIQKLTLLAIAVTAPAVSSAITLYDYFGPAPGMTFGGTGIPNNWVVQSTQIEDGNNLITLGLTATQRYSNPVVTNNGAGIFYAGTGSNDGLDGGGHPIGSTWNWDFYIKVEKIAGSDPFAPAPLFTDYQIDLHYDLDPAPGTNPATLGRINVTAAAAAGAFGPTPNIWQDSYNSMFGFLAVDNLPFLDAQGIAFNPNATGKYQFGISVARDGWQVEAARMEVQIVPVPAAVWLFGSALGLVGVMRRRVTA